MGCTPASTVYASCVLIKPFKDKEMYSMLTLSGVRFAVERSNSSLHLIMIKQLKPKRQKYRWMTYYLAFGSRRFAYKVQS